MDYKVEIGRRIAAARIKRNWSQQDLSEATKGVLSKSRIGMYELGLRMPGPFEANTLAAALGVDAAYLMCLSQVFTQQAIELMRNFMALPEKDRNDYFRRIEVLALAYRQPVPDEKLGPNWQAPKGTKPVTPGVVTKAKKGPIRRP
jgi:transcriptional regulator with XRE-family HTH domain